MNLKSFSRHAGVPLWEGKVTAGQFEGDTVTCEVVDAVTSTAGHGMPYPMDENAAVSGRTFFRERLGVDFEEDGILVCDLALATAAGLLSTGKSHSISDLAPTLIGGDDPASAAATVMMYAASCRALSHPFLYRCRYKTILGVCRSRAQHSRSGKGALWGINVLRGPYSMNVSQAAFYLQRQPCPTDATACCLLLLLLLVLVQAGHRSGDGQNTRDAAPFAGKRAALQQNGINDKLLDEKGDLATHLFSLCSWAGSVLKACNMAGDDPGLVPSLSYAQGTWLSNLYLHIW